MLHARRSLGAAVSLSLLLCFSARADEPVGATIETTLKTAGASIRQLARDGDEATAFASETPPGVDDHFTLVIDRPVKLKSISATTGQPDGTLKVKDGALEVSADGKTFRKLSGFEGGCAKGGPVEEPVKAIRIRPGKSEGPIAIRELTIDSDPAIEAFRYPVEFVVDAADAPEMKDWLEKTAEACARAYPMINRELASEGFRPPRLIRMKLSKRYRGVAATSGDRIVGSVAYFERHKDDVGAMVHETIHVVQSYRRGDRPGWLVEGIADYVRFFKFGSSGGSARGA